ncbi:MAG TPA: ParB N-terminal domain-containing protein [Beijerinckiaceae bacterium]|jgi:hypothetical protein|nr:ParB N-terminal domain-containing protein [Beijerinckiaceae bacterium]
MTIDLDLANIDGHENEVLAGKPQLGWLPVSDLYVDADYQRSLETRASQALIARIVDEFDWCKFQAITAVPRDDEGWFIVDGQHRTEAARRLGETHVPACVVPRVDQSSQAAIFVAANKQKVAVNQYALYHAQIVAGDPVAKQLAAICKRAEIVIPRSTPSATDMPAGVSLALGTLLTLVRRHGPAASLPVEAVASQYRTIKGALRAPFFDGAARYIFESAPERQEEAAARARAFFAATAPEKIFSAAAARGAQGAIARGKAIAEIIRAQSRNDSKPPAPATIVKAAPKPTEVPQPAPVARAAKEQKYRPAEPPSRATPALMTDAQRFAKAVRSGGDIRNIAAGFGISVEEAKRRADALERH